MALETRYLSLGSLPPLSTQVITFDGKINKDQVGVVLQGFGFYFKDSLGSYVNHFVKTMKARILNVRVCEERYVEFEVEFYFSDDSGHVGSGYVDILAIAETN